MQALAMYSVEERIVSIFDGVQVQIGKQPFHDFCVSLSGSAEMVSLITLTSSRNNFSGINKEFVQVSPEA